MVKREGCPAGQVEIHGSCYTKDEFFKKVDQLMGRGMKGKLDPKRLSAAVGFLHNGILETVPSKDECRCRRDDVDSYDYIHYGSMFNEVMSICLNCGGMVT